MVIFIQVLLTLIAITCMQTKNDFIRGFSLLPVICYPSIIAGLPTYEINFNIFLITTVAMMTVYCVEEFIKQKQNLVPRVLVTTVTGYSVAFLTTLL